MILIKQIEEQLHTKEQDYNDLLQSNASLQQNADSNKKVNIFIFSIFVVWNNI